MVVAEMLGMLQFHEEEFHVISGLDLMGRKAVKPGVDHRAVSSPKVVEVGNRKLCLLAHAGPET